MKTVQARQLFKSYKFEEAVQAYKDELKQASDSDHWAAVDGLGKSLMAAGHYDEAVPYLEQAGNHESDQLPGAPGRQIQLSVCHWMLGDNVSGIRIIRDLVIAVRDRTIRYADLAGGVSQGIILCYMGASLQRPDDITLALEFLAALAKNRSKIKSWPGPAALLILGETDIAGSIDKATGVVALKQAKIVAENDLLKRRQLVNILFAAGLQQRLTGDEAGARTYMAECAGLTNPLIEYEWHLAKKEISDGATSV
jgi:hypothetical protein